MTPEQAIKEINILADAFRTKGDLSARDALKMATEVFVEMLDYRARVAAVPPYVVPQALIPTPSTPDRFTVCSGTFVQ